MVGLMEFVGLFPLLDMSFGTLPHPLPNVFRGTEFLQPQTSRGQRRNTRTPVPNTVNLAESELVGFALMSAEMALHRKNILLQTARELDRVGVFNGTHEMSAETKTLVKKHMNWLLDSLVEADRSYKVARECVKRLTELPEEPVPSSSAGANQPILPSKPVPRDSLANLHAMQLVLGASSASQRSAAAFVARGSVDREMTGILESVGQLLLVAGVHTDRESGLPVGHVFEALPTAVAASVEPMLRMFDAPSDLPDLGTFETHLYNNAVNDRSKALESLLEAAHLLNIECKAAVDETGTGLL